MVSTFWNDSNDYYISLNKSYEKRYPENIFRLPQYSQQRKEPYIKMQVPLLQMDRWHVQRWPQLPCQK